MSATLWVPLVIGAAAIFVLLPRPYAYSLFWRSVVGLVGFGLVSWFVVNGIGWSVESFLFGVFSICAIASGSALVVQRNPARAALSFTLVVLSTCGLFMLLAAPFLMAATIVIYAGAIVVTFLFLLMLAQQEGSSNADDRSREPLLATVTGFLLLGAILFVLNTSYAANGNLQLVDELLGDVRQAQAELAAGQQVNVQAVTNRLYERVDPIIKEGERRELEEDERQRSGFEPVDNATDLRSALQRAEFARRVHRGVEAAYIQIVDEPAGGAGHADMAADLARLARPLTELRDELRDGLGFVRPNRGDPLSSLSGPPANTPLQELRVDAEGRPALPHENAEYLGRSLFGDFLLPVELGGTLLLVAAIGAIAIAQRRVTMEKFV